MTSENYIMAWIRVILIGITVCATSCTDDTVTTSYSTRVDAVADRLFERGWLPDILPQTAQKIRTIIDLDTNVSDGEFSFAPPDSVAFISHLKSMDASQLSDYQQMKYLEKDYTAYRFETEDSWWIFFINAQSGHCEYTSALKRTSL